MIVIKSFFFFLMYTTWEDGFEKDIERCSASDYYKNSDRFRHELSSLSQEYQSFIEDKIVIQNVKSVLTNYFRLRLRSLQLVEIAFPDFKIYKQGVEKFKNQYYQAKGYWVEDYTVGMLPNRKRLINVHLGSVKSIKKGELDAFATKTFRETLWLKFEAHSALTSKV